MVGLYSQFSWKAVSTFQMSSYCTEQNISPNLWHVCFKRPIDVELP